MSKVEQEEISQTAKEALIEPYLKQFGARYLDGDVLLEYPETKIIAPYIKQHLSDAELILDLGFGTGLWFWASFFPHLKRIDGIDLFPEALAEADKVFNCDQAPEGFRRGHALFGEEFGLSDLRRLEIKRGHLIIQDYRGPWPDTIMRTRYDLITEHGGGLGELRSDCELIDVVKRCAQVLKPHGRMLFVNFCMKQESPFEKTLRGESGRHVDLREELFVSAARQAGMKMTDLNTVSEPRDMPDVEVLFYGFATKVE